MGDDRISSLVLKVQRFFPSETPTAWRTPFRSPMNTVSPPTAGDDSPMNPASPVEYFQRSLPLSRSIASSSPFETPTYTTPSTIAADDSIASPASYVHFTRS